jgi:hypothetical protein
MLVLAKSDADFSKGCAHSMIVCTFLLTHPPHNARSDAGDASHNDEERGK